mmetsp:Transcript_42602/g.65333  ORF Transcript_42602/g.65333 Transcript_42602/m.65333 type:complete len:122 (-) Transcript_42602:1623-1988(-)
MQKQAPKYQGAANYKFKNKIGEGAVGEVYQVIHKQTSELFALKRVNKHQAELVSAVPHPLQREQTQEVKNERQILQYLKKVPNIAHMKSAWADKQYYYMLFDYALNGDLTGFLKKKGPLPP